MTKIQWSPSPLLARLVRRFRATRLPVINDEVEWFRQHGSFAAALDCAAWARMPNGKRHGHQCLIPRGVLSEAHEALRAAARGLSSAADFDELHSGVDQAVGRIHGIGPMYVYDTAFRLGANLSLMPLRVYLHAGTAKGARALGFKGKTVEVAELPSELHGLPPHEIEDFLCIYKGVLARRRWRR